MIPIPMQNYVLCEQLSGNSNEVKENGILYKKDSLKVYKIISISECLDDSRFTVGDKVICNSTGTLINLGDSRKYLFKEENIAGKIID